MQLQISLIRLDGGTQPRAAYNFTAAELYAEDMSEGAAFPPVTVFYDGADYWLADGFHRVFATQKIELETIEADVHQGSLEDAQWYSYSANKTNGILRKRDDKERAVNAALRHPKAAEMSDEMIAIHIGVSRKYINQARNSLVTKLQVNPSTRRIGRDGRITNTSNIGKKRKPASKPAPVPRHVNGTSAPKEEDEPLTPYEESIARAMTVTAPISEPSRVAPEVLAKEADRLVAQYCYEDVRQLIEELSERIAVDVS